MDSSNLISTGIILLIVITIAYGWTFLLKVSRGSVPVNDLQRSFYRAGHAHAGVLVILGLVVRLCLQHPAVPAWSTFLAGFVLDAAVLMRPVLPDRHGSRSATTEPLDRSAAGWGSPA